MEIYNLKMTMNEFSGSQLDWKQRIASACSSCDLTTAMAWMVVSRSGEIRCFNKQACAPLSSPFRTDLDG
jgi:hypothetical protein